MAVTLKDVAERAGVSRSAVSRTFTEGASVSAKTRQKVEHAAQALGYRPNVLASSLTTGRTKLIGLVSNNFHNPIFLEVFDRFTRGLQERGLRPLLVNLSDETDPENSVRMLLQYSVDAVIVASSTLPASFAHSFHDAGVPVVHSFGRHMPNPKVPIVGIDNVAAGRLAARTLIGKGYRRIGMMAGPKSATSTEDRVAGFLEECLRRASRHKESLGLLSDSQACARRALHVSFLKDPTSPSRSLISYGPPEVDPYCHRRLATISHKCLPARPTERRVPRRKRACMRHATSGIRMQQ